MSELRTDMLPGYVLTRRLGSGGMADVYEARQLNLDRLVAIKIRRRRYDEFEPLLKERFVKSASLHAKVIHPHIVRVIDFIATEEVEGLVLERLEGPTLEDRLHETGPIEVPQLVFMLRGIADALVHLHDKGIIHRDIKPGNLMHVSSRALSPIRLMDFGVARSLSGSQNLTVKGSQIGTIWYMSPEQLASKVPKPSCDLFSLAVSAYELATGRLPLSAREQAAVFRRYLDNEAIPEWPTHLVSEFPEFCDLLESALQVDAESRLTNVKVFRSCLAALCEKYPTRPMWSADPNELTEFELETSLRGLPEGIASRLRKLSLDAVKQDRTLTLSTRAIDEASEPSTSDQTVLTEPLHVGQDGDV